MVTKEPTSGSASPKRRAPAEDRQERLAKALRDNLKRRKQQARARKRTDGGGAARR